MSFTAVLMALAIMLFLRVVPALFIIVGIAVGIKRRALGILLVTVGLAPYVYYGLNNRGGVKQVETACTTAESTWTPDPGTKPVIRGVLLTEKVTGNPPATPAFDFERVENIAFDGAYFDFIEYPNEGPESAGLVWRQVRGKVLNNVKPEADVEVHFDMSYAPASNSSYLGRAKISLIDRKTGALRARVDVLALGTDGVWHDAYSKTPRLYCMAGTKPFEVPGIAGMSLSEIIKKMVTNYYEVRK